jgi:iron complex outermembrane receptor protein
VQSDEVDLGARWSVRGVLVKAQAFHAWLTDYVVLAPATGVAPGGAAVTAKTYRNVSARTLGGEASARIALPLRLFAIAGLTYVRGENLSDDVPLAELPPLRANLALRLDTGAFFVEAEEQLAARQDRVDPSVEEHATPGWAITNLRAGAEWGRVKLVAGVRNAFDEAYAEHLAGGARAAVSPRAPSGSERGLRPVRRAPTPRRARRGSPGWSSGRSGRRPRATSGRCTRGRAPSTGRSRPRCAR